MSEFNLALIDIGANLAHDCFDHDRDEVLARAQAAGVTRIIVTGSTTQSSLKALELSRDSPGRLFATAGIHPHHAAEFCPEARSKLASLGREPAVVAIGECGLDYYRNLAPKQDQQHAFVGQLSLATALAKPVFLHQRDAHADFLSILREFRRSIVGGVAHCFTGTRAQMEGYLEMDLYIGVTGWICDERRGEDLRAAVSGLPLDRVLIETDAPYLLPRNLPHKPASRRNEPSLLPLVLRTTAYFMGVATEELAVAATRNAERLFRLLPHPANG